MMASRPMRLAINTSSELHGGAPTQPPKSEPTVVCKVPGTSGLRANLVCLPGEGALAVNNSHCMTALAHHSPLEPQTALLRSMPSLAWMLFWKFWVTSLARFSNKRRCVSTMEPCSAA